ncbi:hypothetical protein WH43_01185 [Rheinheimera sp. KL1]|uniref:DUF6088 family protein n=1 Tax=Rheinheimera sp. KL1 TaxID=1635005 RepID=UPI0006A9706C|nr:DUF6088 family protein [Rheinheimera sp. KL1]KOO59967.1 hypothetical protein WH43_01185 [Rheinheimera sp. KL1]
MTIAQSVYKQIEKIKPGKLFSYQDISVYAEHSEAVVKAVNRNADKLGLMKVKKGLFYKAEFGRFGPMAPQENEIIQYFTKHKSKIVGYITGPALYYQWGLTTQVPVEINIATAAKKNEKANFFGLRVSTLPARYKNISEKNTELLQFLDILNNIERIPDSNVDYVSNKLSSRLIKFSDESIKDLEHIAKVAYSERTKALLGTFFEHYLSYFSKELHSSLNPSSTYLFSNSTKMRNAQKHWHLKFSTLKD